MWQILRLGHIPYEEEVLDAIEKEYARCQAEARKPPANYAKDIKEVCKSTLAIGGRLARMEGIIRQFMRSMGDNIL